MVVPAGVIVTAHVGVPTHVSLSAFGRLGYTTLGMQLGSLTIGGTQSWSSEVTKVGMIRSVLV